MVQLGTKAFIAIIAVVVIVVSLAFCVTLNIGGLGTTLSGVGGPVAKGFYNLLVKPLQWALSSGWPTLGVFYLISFLAFPCFIAYLVWHYDVPLKVTGAASASPASNFTNTMNREPETPERSPTTKQ